MHRYYHGDIAALKNMQDGRRDLMREIVQMDYVRLLDLDKSFDLTLSLKRIDHIKGRGHLAEDIRRSVIIHMRNKIFTELILGVRRVLHSPVNDPVPLGGEKLPQIKGIYSIPAFGK